MRSTMSISLPPQLQRWVADQVESRGFDDASEFIRDMIRRERKKTLRIQIEHAVCEALKTPVSEMTDSDWSDIERQGKELASAKRQRA